MGIIGRDRLLIEIRQRPVSPRIRLVRGLNPAVRAESSQKDFVSPRLIAAIAHPLDVHRLTDMRGFVTKLLTTQSICALKVT
jgi:hypothetical protein